jgi:hypothetical protein
MNIVNLFPVDFFEFKNSSIDNQDIIKKLDQLSGPVKQGSVVSYLNPIHQLEEFNELFSWTNRGAKVVAKTRCQRNQNIAL